jgi:glycine cleavage system protein P-like pyridoxal-binding family
MHPKITIAILKEKIMSDSMPIQTPPQVKAAESVCMPYQVPPVALATAEEQMEPSLLPPQVDKDQAEGITAWQNGQKITALWSNNANRNSWVYVANIGWKKLADNSDSAVVALNVLAAHAQLKGTVVNYREDADTKIHEIYVW